MKRIRLNVTGLVQLARPEFVTGVLKPRLWQFPAVVLRQSCAICLCILLLSAGCLPHTSTPLPTLTLSPLVTVAPTVARTPTVTSTPMSSLTTLTLWVPDFLDPFGETEAGALLLNHLQTFSLSNPDVQVQVQVKAASGPGSLYNLLRTAYTAAPAVLPDLVLLNYTQLQEAAHEGFIRPLPPALVDASDYYSFTLQSAQVAGQVYGLPLLTQIEQTVYHAEVTETPPVSWTVVLTGSYSLLFPAGPLDGLASDALLLAYRGAGGAVVDESGKPTLDRARLEDLYRFFGTLVEADLLQPELVLGLPDAEACWAHYQEGVGQLSIVPAGSYWAVRPAGARPGWIPTPSGQIIAQGRMWAIAIVSQTSERQPQALALAEWLAQPEQTVDLAMLARRLPARRSAVDLLALSREDRQFLESLMNAAELPLPEAVDIPVRTALQAGLEALLRQQVESPEAAATYALTVLRR